MIDYNARYYSPVLGRFVSPDSIVPEPGSSQGWNRYMYVSGNPIMYTDPTGNFGCGDGCDNFYAPFQGVWDEGVNQASQAYDIAADLTVDYTVGYAAYRTHSFNHSVDVLKNSYNGSTVGEVGYALWDVSMTGLEIAEMATPSRGVGTRLAREGVETGASTAWGVGRNAVRWAFRSCSFSEDTLIATENGYIPIALIEDGQQVWAYNEATGTIDLYPVTAVWSEKHRIIVYLTINGEVLETTREHPFKTTSGEYVPAGTLQVGDEIISNGQAGRVESIRFVYAPQLMYNLSVAEAHTYFVGQGQWLVHNDCWSIKIRDLNPLHSPQTSGIRPDLSRLSDSELLEAVINPKNADHILINTKTGQIMDGNGRAYELLRRMDDPNSSISPDLEIPYKPYTPDDSFFWDLD